MSEVAWLIEETWSGHVHYVHRGFDALKWIREAQSISRNGYEWERRGTAFVLTTRKPTVPFITKNVDEAMRFLSGAEAMAWLEKQPRWLSRGDQYQVREHLWLAPSDTSEPS